MNLQTSRLNIEFTEMENNPSTRFEHLPYISQVTLDGKHSFLSKEMTKAGPGTNGEGLMHGFLNYPEFDKIQKGNFYAVIGVGIVKIPKAEYTIRENFPCDFVESSIVSESDTSKEFRLLQPEYEGISYEINRKYYALNETVEILTHVKNLGDSEIFCKEYCHNFFQFDKIPIGISYSLKTGDWKNLDIVRGDIILGKNYYSPNNFDNEIGTIALLYNIVNEKNEQIKIFNSESKTSVTVTNEFEACERYHWISPWCLSPETFVKIKLKKGESCSYKRTYKFDTI